MSTSHLNAVIATAVTPSSPPKVTLRSHYRDALSGLGRMTESDFPRIFHKVKERRVMGPRRGQ